MAIIKCKMCGGDLTLVPGSTVAVCEYCGTQQTVPSADNEKKMTLFNRANRLRFGCEFDKAAGIYEAIVADFPEEAEAYWGLVLCKYGIEYVDDPATAKKIPTCHRSSFDSIMDDENFEQTLENADAVARKMYRAEAKQIEEIRKGIIEVSSKEDPYDIFICYKETDENGERTLDSVLAQDLYDTLTEKGYRTFFARITLEDKLGQKYEPYIFAALNSAKIMLAVGTDYEYYNAVWVKNEWSRFLHLITSGQKKTLIPCYKNIDAYDMPKEFAKLQAQDLGKVGAIQDLLRGIEKILPRNKPVNLIQEKVVVGNAGTNKLTSLLDRGNMALEDGNWAKADSFFEDVLNNDSKNAQAYLGKLMAREKCRTLDAFVRKRQAVTEKAQISTLYFEPDEDYHPHIESAAGRYAIENYLKEDEIRAQYHFQFSYSSELPSRIKQKEMEEQYWANDRVISRAIQFASGPVETVIRDTQKMLFVILDNRIAQAKKQDEASFTQHKKAYADHMHNADCQVEKMHDAANKKRAERYEELLGEALKAERIKDSQELERVAAEYRRLSDYSDSLKRAEACHRKAEALIAQQKRNVVRRDRIITASLVVIAVIIVLYAAVIRPAKQYGAAEALYESGHYNQALAAFVDLESYKDSAELAESILQEHIELYRNEAERLMLEDDRAGLCELLAEIKGNYRSGAYTDALMPEIIARMNAKVPHNTLAAGAYHSVAVLADGTVAATGFAEDGQCDVADWNNIIGVAAKGRNTFGLRADGTVVTTGIDENGESNVSRWSNIIGISAGKTHTVGLRADGTVVAVGSNSDKQCDVEKWQQMIDVCAGNRFTAGLRADGTVELQGYRGTGKINQAFKWGAVIDICSGGEYIVGLKEDGTVVAAGDNTYGQCEVERWSDIVSICASDMFTIGVKSDGTVLIAGKHSFGAEIEALTDVVAIATSSIHLLAQKSDGSVVAIGRNDQGQCDVSEWSNVMRPNLP